MRHLITNESLRLNSCSREPPPGPSFIRFAERTIREKDSADRQTARAGNAGNAGAIAAAVAGIGKGGLVRMLEDSDLGSMKLAAGPPSAPPTLSRTTLPRIFVLS
jgi:hypothetical protein